MPRRTAPKDFATAWRFSPVSSAAVVRSLVLSAAA